MSQERLVHEKKCRPDRTYNDELATAAPGMLYKVMRRVYVEPQNLDLKELHLPADEARYLRQVLRMKKGDSVELFDGHGKVAHADIIHLDKHEIICKINDLYSIDPEPHPQLHIALALIKNDALDLALRMLCELGVHRVQLLRCEHSVTRWKKTGADSKQNKALQRLRRVAIAALRQSKRAWMPQISPPMALADWPASCASGPRYFGDLPPNETSDESLIDDDRDAPQAPKALSMAIGPEGGFSEDERTLLLRHNVRPVRLGPHILRADTAAIVAASWLRCKKEACGEAFRRSTTDR